MEINRTFVKSQKTAATSPSPHSFLFGPP